MSTDPIPTIPDHIADLARAALWIETVGLRIEAEATPDDVWFRASTHNEVGGFSGKWRFGSIVETVESAVVNAGREWTEYDDRLFGPQS